MDKKKVGIIVQRYGLEVNGGAEVHARMIAEHLSKLYKVTVLTSQAIEYQSWKPEYPEGLSQVEGIDVIRFSNQTRNAQKQKFYRRKVTYRHPLQRVYRVLNFPGWFKKLFPSVKIKEEDHRLWLEAQGPAMPGLLAYLQQHQKEYAAFIFFTALYYPTAMGVMTVPQKSILVPTMHDEKPMYFPIYQKVMSSPAWIMFNTRSEMHFSERLFNLKNASKEIVGVGIELLRETLVANSNVLQYFNITRPYIIYVGRVDKNKGCDVLIKYFTKYINQTKADIQLVLVGKAMMRIPDDASIIHTGFVDDHQKNQLMLQAEALCIPSFFESLSLVLLESFACGVPVIANGKTEVLRDHIEDSGGGWNFYFYQDFANAMNEIIYSEQQRKEKGERGYTYVKNNYSWNKVLRKFTEAISDVETKSTTNFIQ